MQNRETIHHPPKRLLERFFEKHGKEKITTLKFKCTPLKQDLRSRTEKPKYQKKIIEGRKINKLLY